MKQILSLFAVLITCFTCNAQMFSEDKTSNNKKFENGTVLSSQIGTFHGGNFYMCKEVYDPLLLGVYYDKTPDREPNPRMAIIPIKTKGITWVKYNEEGGKIHKGDPLTSSSTPGEAMKATNSGIILGIALEDATTPSGLIKIRVLIQYVK